MLTPIIQEELAALETEKRNVRTTEIDRSTTLDFCRIFNREDQDVPIAVEDCIPQIAEVIDALSERVRNGGRVFYIGAGTSGRLGVLDASEIPPTYSAPPDQFIALIAGGDDALRHALEGAENNRAGAQAGLEKFNLDPTVDSLIGIASSGRTPYVLGGLSYAKALGVTTVGLVCVFPSEVMKERNADYLISVLTGPEAITGSTRMKAGTAIKMVLNMISTGIMVKLGKTYGNLMIDMKATNNKLHHRARNILRLVGGKACNHSDVDLDQILLKYHGSVKVAAVAIVLKISVLEAEERLRRNHGILTQVLTEARVEDFRSLSLADSWVLCVDAGGTSCKAVVLSKSGEMGMGMAGPCNVTNVGVDAAISTISQAIKEAIRQCKSIKGRPVRNINLSSAWIGMAGYDRPSLPAKLQSSLAELLGLPLGPKLKVTNDVDLLLAPMAGKPGIETVIAVVAGTGSVAMNYALLDEGFQRLHRVGGWGSLLGDCGSAYEIGREALRTTLRASELRHIYGDSRVMPPFPQAVFEYLKDLRPESKPDAVLNAILVPDPTLHEASGATLATTKLFAGAARVVLAMAKSEPDANSIFDAAIASLSNIVWVLASRQPHPTTISGLVLAGGLTRDQLYQSMLMTSIIENCGRFKEVEIVDQPAVAGARYLAARI